MINKILNTTLMNMTVALAFIMISCGQKKETYEVGDLYDNGRKGVVVAVDNSKKHGTIMSLESYKCSGDNASYKVSELGTGWYVPSIDELREMYSNLDIINETLENKGEHITVEYIWSSSIEDGKMLSLKTTDGSIERNIPSSCEGYCRFFKKF